MTKVYFFLLVGIIAIGLVIVSLVDFDAKVETWSSLLAGAAIGFLIVRLPTIVTFIKEQKGAK